jgi:D-amino-acid oxidase
VDAGRTFASRLIRSVNVECFTQYQLLRTNLPEGTVLATSFTTLTIDTPAYLPYLLARFQSKGGSLIRSSLQHISQVLGGSLTPFKPDALVVCAGIGAHFLGGVEDKNVFPIRGQTVLIRAPWVKFGRALRGKGEPTYIIARRSGDVSGNRDTRRMFQILNRLDQVILGGTRGEDDWYSKPRPKTKISILKRAISLAPELAPPGTENPTYEDLIPLIVEEGCGLRPGRKGGIRLERETVSGVPVVHNYGYNNPHPQPFPCTGLTISITQARRLWLSDLVGLSFRSTQTSERRVVVCMPAYVL